MVNAGEVYTTKEEKWAPERATVVVTLEEVPSWHHDEMIECLVVVDDSIVRGTTTPKVVEMLRNAGATEVHMRICAPPIMHPCHFGIDMATQWELIASHKEIEQIRQQAHVHTHRVASAEPKRLSFVNVDRRYRHLHARDSSIGPRGSQRSAPPLA